jgi:hypothetical protein
MTKQISIETPFSAENIRQILKKETTEVKNLILSFSGGSKTKILTCFQDDGFNMRVRHRYSNGLTSFFKAKIIPSGNGSRVEGSFYILWWVKVLMAALILIYLIPAFMFFKSEQTQGAFPFLLTVILLLAICILARLLGRKDEKEMETFLADLFKN